jgi:hypothetical protein
MAVKAKTLVLLSLPVVWVVCVLAAAGALIVFGEGFSDPDTLGIASLGSEPAHSMASPRAIL